MDEETRLALEARDGDELSLAGFVRRTQADVWRYVAHLVDRDAADDLTQDVYLRAIPALGRYRGDAPAKVWLLTIARRVCADELRHRTRRAGHGSQMGRAHPRGEPHVPDPSGAADLTALIANLEPDGRAAFVLTQLLGFRYEDAAQVCGVPIGTIRSRVARARAALVTAATDGATVNRAEDRHRQRGT